MEIRNDEIEFAVPVYIGYGNLCTNTCTRAEAQCGLKSSVAVSEQNGHNPLCRSASAGSSRAGTHDEVELAIPVHVSHHQRVVGRSARFIVHRWLEGAVTVPDEDTHVANVVGTPPVCNNDVELAVALEVRDLY